MGETTGDDRRRFIKKAAVGVGAAWVAPTVLSMHSVAAAASGGSSFSLPVGGPRVDIGCGSFIVLPAGPPNTYGLYQTAGFLLGNVANSITGVGANVTGTTPPLPVTFPPPQPIEFTTDGPITAALVDIGCLRPPY